MVSPALSKPEFDGQIKRIWDLHYTVFDCCEECIISPSHADPISGKIILFFFITSSLSIFSFCVANCK